MKEFARTEFTRHVDQVLEDKGVYDTFNRWLDRGDGIAVYENKAMDSANHGHQQFVSFGSAAAQIESETPPERMPDIGTKINWGYMLVGTYRGDRL